jgi:hypothetical protein
MAIIEEYAVVVGGGVAPFGLITLSLDLEIGRLAISRCKVHVLF